MNMNAKDIFHVHTYRCGHAQMVPDEAYIQKAIEIGASGIWFTDHAPFPGDPFGNRMIYTDLEAGAIISKLLEQRIPLCQDRCVRIEIVIVQKRGHYGL